jgi:hypothetical protein
MAGRSFLYSLVRRQSLVSHSSTEAEIYAGTTGVSEAEGIRRLLDFAGIKRRDGSPLGLKLRMDNSSARILLSRHGTGKIRHLSIRCFWVQDMVKGGFLRIYPIAGTENASDIGTKPLARARLDYLLAKLSMGEFTLGAGSANLAVARIALTAPTAASATSVVSSAESVAVPATVLNFLFARLSVEH